MATSSVPYYKWFTQYPSSRALDAASTPDHQIQVPLANDALASLICMSIKDDYYSDKRHILLHLEPFVTVPRLLLGTAAEVSHQGRYYYMAAGEEKTKYNNQRERARALMNAIYRQREEVFVEGAVQEPALASDAWVRNEYYRGSVSFTGPIGVGKSSFVKEVREHGMGITFLRKLSYMCEVWGNDEFEVVFVFDFDEYIKNFLRIHEKTPKAEFSFHANNLYRDTILALHSYFGQADKAFLCIFDRFWYENVVFHLLYDWVRPSHFHGKDGTFAQAVRLFWPGDASRAIFWALYPHLTFLCVRSYDPDENVRLIQEGVTLRGRPFERDLKEDASRNFYRAFLACLPQEKGATCILKTYTPFLDSGKTKVQADATLVKAVGRLLVKCIKNPLSIENLSFMKGIVGPPAAFVTTFTGLRLYLASGHWLATRVNSEDEWLAYCDAD